MGVLGVALSNASIRRANSDDCVNDFKDNKPGSVEISIIINYN